jgi:hypothetical protein
MRVLHHENLRAARFAAFDALEHYSQVRLRPLPCEDVLFEYMQIAALDAEWQDLNSRNLLDLLTDIEAQRPEGALEDAYVDWQRVRRRR